MGTILNNIIENMMNDKNACYAIEHSSKSGWYLFDVDQSKKITEAIWIKDIKTCLA